MLKKFLSIFSTRHTSFNGINKLEPFIQYLSSRANIQTIITEKGQLSQDKFEVPITTFTPALPVDVIRNSVSLFINSISLKKIADYNSVFYSGKYFVVVHQKHDEVAAHCRQLGLQFLEGTLKNGEQVSPLIIGGTDVNYKEQVHKRKIAAIIHVFNESDIIGETIQFLISEGIHVHIIDNWSTDNSWEIITSFPEEQVSRERFPFEGPSDHYEWFKQLEYSEQVASRLPFDWFIHYDADEFRYSPWQGVSLQNAISFVDELGYNAIDFTVLDFRFTTDNDAVTAGFEKNIPFFEFGKRPGHFLQVKAWKKQNQPVDLKNSGGHNVLFEGRKTFPIKFLTKHYSLRSTQQAIKKLQQHRLPRVQKELSERGWHSHIGLLIEQQNKGWNKADLIQWNDHSFHKDLLLERISGVGIVASPTAATAPKKTK